MRAGTRDLLTFAELDASGTSRLLDLAARLKRGAAGGKKAPLAGRTLAMIFQKPSTRTRVSFEVGMHQLGGHAVALAPGDMQLSRGETLGDTARTLSRYADAVLARVFAHSDVEALAAGSSIPVINGLSDAFHPCQTLADLMTVREKKGSGRGGRSLEGLKLAWIGDGNNVCNSLILGCARTGMDVSVAAPKGFEPLEWVVRESREAVRVDVSADPAAAAGGADVVATDTFKSIHNEDAGRLAAFLPRYRVGRRLMGKAKKDAVFMHCLPATRGREVEAAVIDGPQSAVWDEAENRLHSQKALLLALLGPGAPRCGPRRPASAARGGNGKRPA